MIIIKDPQNLLPDSFYSTKKLDIEWLSNKVLEVPSHGISLHKKSLRRLLDSVTSKNTIIAFQPALPVLSQLGLPNYPTLAYVYPQELEDEWSQIRSGIAATAHCSRNPYKLLSQVDYDEKLHYFSHWYGRAIPPSYVRVIVSNSCNLKCTMCPYHSLLLKPSHNTDFFSDTKVMSWTMMERLAADCGRQAITVLIGSIEEPLMHPRIYDFIRLCRQKGVPKVHLTTNGQLLDKARAEKLLNAGLTSLDISIDAATPETYLRIRGADLARVETNILNFLNIREQLGCTCEVRASLVRNEGVSREEEEAFLDVWLSRLNSVFILNVAEYKKSNIQLASTNQAVSKSIQTYREQSQGRWACLFPFKEMAILPDGRTFYCIETLFRLGFDSDVESLGDYHYDSLQEIWSGKLFQQLREDLILNLLDERLTCKNCEMWKSQVIEQEVTNGNRILTTTVTEIYSRV